METFRCPTCIGVLVDAHARRCTTCGQGLRRRHPRVLGEERRLGANMLAIDRMMLARLHGEHRGRPRRRALPPPAWHGRFAPSPRSAEPDLVLPPVVEPPAPSTAAPSGMPAVFGAIDAAIVEDTMAVEAIPETPATVNPLSLDAFVAPGAAAAAAIAHAQPEVAHPDTSADGLLDPRPFDSDEFGGIALGTSALAAAVIEPETFEPETFAPGIEEFDMFAPSEPRPRPSAPAITPQVVAHNQLDPDVRALVDDLYEQARAELSGFEPTIDTDAPIDYEATDPVPMESPAVSDVVVSRSTPVEPDAPIVPEPPADSPSARATPQTRGGWVPAFVADEQRRGRISD